MSNESAFRERTNTQEIERGRWVLFLDELTRENRGAHGRLEVLDGEAGYLVETEDKPFDGVSADVRDGEHAVWITFGATADDRLTHGIRRVTAIRTAPGTLDTPVVLGVDSADGTRTILELSPPDAYALPPATEQIQNS
jgi:hypothetical protein